MKRPNYICLECAKDLKPRTGLETLHIGHCDVCGEDDKNVAPARWYGYPVVCEKDGLVVPIHKMDGMVCPVCRIVLN